MYYICINNIYIHTAIMNSSLQGGVVPLSIKKAPVSLLIKILQLDP